MEEVVIGRKLLYMIRCKYCDAINYIYSHLYNGKTYTCGKCQKVGTNQNMV